MKFLIIEDNPTDRKILLWTLQKKFRDSEFVNVIGQKDFYEAISQHDFDMVITNYHLAWTDGLWILKTIKGRVPYVPVIMVADTENESVVAEGMRSGLDSFVIKTHLDSLPAQINESLEKANLRKMYDEVRSFLNDAGDAIFAVDTEGNLLNVNKMAEALTGYAREELLTMNFVQLHPKAEIERIVTAFKEGMRRGSGSVNDTLMLRKDGKTVPIDITGSVIEFGGKKIGQAIIRDITDRKLIERRLAVQYAVARILVESSSLKEAAQKILQAICEYLEWDLGDLWSIDKKTNMLCCVEIWHKPSVKVTEFEALSRQITFSPGIGLPGRIWANGKPSWIPDVVSDTNFPRAPIAAKEGLRGAFGFPILIGSGIFGVLEFFSHEIRQPDEELLKMMTAIGSQIGQFIVRKQAEETLQYRLDFEKTIARISTRFANLSDFNNAIFASLADIGRLCNASRTCLFQFRDNGAIMDNTHEWCSEEVKPEIQNLQNISSAIFPWWMANLHAGNVIHITDTSKMSPEASAEKENLEKFGIKSLLALPVYTEKKLVGFVSLNNVVKVGTWHEEYTDLLRIMAEIIGGAIARKQAEATITQMAFHDALTKLPNRNLLQDHLQMAIDSGKRNEKTAAVMFLDLDGFKNINDSFNHHTGDLLLRAVAERLIQRLRKSDTACRMGGDEFTVILPDLTHAQDAAIVAQKTLDNLSQPYQIEGHEIHTTASIGISLYPSDADNPDDLLKKADIAMYRSKKEGKNTYRFFKDEYV
ncbi:MAG: diguanylate cyclase [Planctomycetes bacterium]|nr:diguanylate cyclase [Planctomycetota bacterium]